MAVLERWFRGVSEWVFLRGEVRSECEWLFLRGGSEWLFLRGGSEWVFLRGDSEVSVNGCS